MNTSVPSTLETSLRVCLSARKRKTDHNEERIGRERNETKKRED